MTHKPLAGSSQISCYLPTSSCKCRNIKAHDRKVRKARAKQNKELAKRLAALTPTYRLDHLVKER